MANDAFHLKIISPAAIIVDDAVPQVEIPGVEGDFGVLPGHSPLFSMIRPGVINVKMSDGNERKFFALSGYADVTPESCTVISDHIRDLSEMNAGDAEKMMSDAKMALAKTANDNERQQAEKQLQAAEALGAALR